MTEAQKSQLIYQLALDVSIHHSDRPDADMLVNNPSLLRGYVKQSVNIWRRVADAMKVPQNHIYHWYNETYVRHITNVEVSKTDVSAIQDILLTSIRKTGKVDRSLRKKVYELINHYEKPIFDKAYNQCLAICRRNTGNTRRPAARSLSMSSSEQMAREVINVGSAGGMESDLSGLFASSDNYRFAPQSAKMMLGPSYYPHPASMSALPTHKKLENVSPPMRSNSPQLAYDARRSYPRPRPQAPTLQQVQQAQAAMCGGMGPYSLPQMPPQRISGHLAVGPSPPLDCFYGDVNGATNTYYSGSGPYNMTIPQPDVPYTSLFPPLN